MKVQVLYFQGCPNHKPAVNLIRSVDPDAMVEEVEVNSPADAERLRFLGSPTILVDGIDVEPSARNRTDFGFSCRTYDGRGLPSRELIAAALASQGCCAAVQSEAPRSIWFAAGSVASAVVASACCWLPLLLLAFGVSAAGVSATFEPLRPWFLAVTAVLLAVGFYFAYRKESCCAPKSRRFNRAMLWIATIVVLAVALFPSYAGLFNRTPFNAAAVSPGDKTITLKIEGMTCEACAAHLERALAEVPGVKAASVSYAKGEAILTIDPASPPTRADLIKTVEEAGYRVEG
jgi:mercuric ion transport protein